MAGFSRDIQALNDMVDAKTSQAIEEAKGGKQLDIEFEFASKPKSLLYAGAPIYEDRFASMVYFATAACAYLVATKMLELGVLPTLIVALCLFVLYDFYSGILHIVLDHPPFIRLPLIGQPCLEFQWHHIIPDDLCRKDFSQVCGDLNLAVYVMLPLNWLVWAKFGTDPVVVLASALKVLMAYLGQYSHRSAHQVNRAKRGGLTCWLQDVGVLISVGDHHKHHTPPHNTNFCLIGICNVVVGAIFKTISANAQLALFIAMSLFDVPVLCWALKQTILS